MIQQMVSHPDARAQDFSSLRLATSAGEALPSELHERWMETFGVELLDGLGTAEMWHIFLSNRPGDVVPGTLGRAVPGFEVKLCDADGREVADGEVGALWVKGESRAIGYWQQMDDTMRAFRGEWYVSGDMLRQNADGTFSLLRPLRRHAEGRAASGWRPARSRTACSRTRRCARSPSWA